MSWCYCHGHAFWICCCCRYGNAFQTHFGALDVAVALHLGAAAPTAKHVDGIWKLLAPLLRQCSLKVYRGYWRCCYCHGDVFPIYFGLLLLMWQWNLRTFKALLVLVLRRRTLRVLCWEAFVAAALVMAMLMGFGSDRGCWCCCWSNASQNYHCCYSNAFWSHCGLADALASEMNFAGISHLLVLLL